MNRWRLLKEGCSFLEIENKKLCALTVTVLLLVFVQGSVLAPFIYTVF